MWKMLLKFVMRKALAFKCGELLYRKIAKSTPESSRARVLLIRALCATITPRVFIETGTYLGDTTWQLKDDFQKIYTIEIEPHFFRFAVKRFKNTPQVKVLRGDSGEILAKLLPEVTERCLFFLDAHYSGGISGKGRENNPILNELSAIQNHFRNDHIIVIDDARLFNGTDGYPTREELIKKLKNINSNYKIEEKEGLFLAIP